jgi:hypothetical protein
LGRIMLIGSFSQPPDLVTVFTDGYPILYNPDTGADVTLLDPNVYHKMKPRPLLVPNNANIRPYGASSPLDIKGCLMANLTEGNKSINETVFVISRQNRGISLFHVGLQRCWDLLP